MPFQSCSLVSLSRGQLFREVCSLTLSLLLCLASLKSLYFCNCHQQMQLFQSLISPWLFPIVFPHRCLLGSRHGYLPPAPLTKAPSGPAKLLLGQPQRGGKAACRR